MPEITCSFSRYEEKYVLTAEQYRALVPVLRPHLIPDEFGKSTVLSLYLDTPDHRLIRNSIEAVNYKEKLRLRSYGTAQPGGTVFLEMKKKFDGQTYKRRVGMTTDAAGEYLSRRLPPEDSQIMRELNRSMSFWGWPQPAVLIACEREAFFLADLPALRLTFDTGVRYRDTRADLTLGSDGKLLLPEDRVLMEFKTDRAMPLWLAHALSSVGAAPASFSKYGMAYRDILARQAASRPGILIHKGEFTHESSV